MDNGIRTLTAEELDESIALSCFAFQYELTKEEREERRRQSDPNRIWGYFVEGRLAAKLHIHDLRVFVQGQPVRMGGVASVATWPEYRRGGMVAALLTRGLEAMREEGQVLSCLHPFAVSFYRKFGWELYADYKTYELKVSQLPRPADPGGSVIRANCDWPLLASVYTPYASRYNGTLARDLDWWQQRVFKQKGGQAAVYRDKAGEPRGYLLYSVQNREMKIGEMIFLDEAARAGLWRFIANHDSMCDTIRLQAPSDDELPFLLPDPRIEQQTHPYFSARIVDFMRFIGQTSFAATGQEQRLTIRIMDRYAPWNDGTFRLRIDGQGRASAESIGSGEEGRGADDGDDMLEGDIGAVTAMLLGYKRPLVLHRLGALSGQLEAVRAWEGLVPQRSTYFPDYF